MDIRKTIATIMAAMFILSLTACAVIPNENSGGVGDTQTNSNSISFIGNGNVDGEEPPAVEPVKEIDIWDVLPEIPVTDASAFKYKYDMLDMFKLLKKAKCKVILFHSRSYWFDSKAASYGLHKVGYYVSGNTDQKHKPYYTEVYSLNTDPSVKFFDPKNHGELY